MTMTDRERILAIVEGRSPDRIPWIPRLEIYYEAHCRRGTLPARFANATLREMERGLGMGAGARQEIEAEAGGVAALRGCTSARVAYADG